MNLGKSSSANNGSSIEIAPEADYKQKRLRNISFLIGLFALLVVSVLVSLRAGSYDTPTLELVRGILGKAHDPKINTIVINNRLPRILTALISGAGLGISGCVLQAILRNPLASSSTLGVSQGAGFGAAFAIIVLNAGVSAGAGAAAIPLCAFAGSMAVAFTILGLSKISRVTPEGIVLAGVAISSIFTGATTLIQYFANEIQLATLVFWTFGNLGSTDMREILMMSAVIFPASAYFFYHRWDYNALLSGTETAVSLGINVSRLTLINMIVCCFVASTIVSNIGLIAFIGLVAPHLVRLVVGNNHVYLLPGSMLGGATLLLLGDLFSRIAISPIILPIGAITSFLGGPLFLYLLFKGGSRRAES
ncbi:MAG: iron ABC transporter permease [Ruminococcaceae bacterium]|nr:iron ABC transporter permease [Oscillospiraceae bacterium]